VAARSALHAVARRCSALDHRLKDAVMATLRITDIRANFKSQRLDWSKAMSMGQTAQESERAKATKWRQFIQVIDDPDAQAVCEVASQFLTAKTQTPQQDCVETAIPPELCHSNRR
jgi:hypothetical protein